MASLSSASRRPERSEPLKTSKGRAQAVALLPGLPSDLLQLIARYLVDPERLLISRLSQEFARFSSCWRLDSLRIRPNEFAQGCQPSYSISRLAAFRLSVDRVFINSLEGFEAFRQLASEFPRCPLVKDIKLLSLDSYFLCRPILQSLFHPRFHQLPLEGLEISTLPASFALRHLVLSSPRPDIRSVLDLPLSFFPFSLHSLDFSSVDYLDGFSFPSLARPSWRPLEFSAFPHLKELKMPSNYNLSLSSAFFPPNLEVLTLGQYFNSPFLVPFPPSLIHLIFPVNGHFNQPIENPAVLRSSSLQRIQFGFFFNQSINDLLPHSLVFLSFGENFNFPISPQGLPPSLLALHFNASYSQTIEGRTIFPPNLEELTLYKAFSSSLSGLLPSSLTALNFPSSCDFQCPVEEFSLPAGLKSLRFSFDYSQTLEENSLPAGLQSLGELSLLPAVGALPNFLTSLTFSSRFNSGWPEDFLPSSLRSLTFTGDQYFPLFPKRLPPLLDRLHFQGGFYPIPPNLLPRRLEGKFLCDYEDSHKFYRPPKLLKGKVRLSSQQLSESLGLSPQSIFLVIRQVPWNPRIYEIELLSSSEPIRFFILYFHLERMKKGEE